ncbi:MAG: ATP-binding protein [Bacteroidetes bacterium]|nr:ATP-binding protein [Bacteroidota bacterium]
MGDQIEYKNVETKIAEPDASSTFESYRAIGYSMETAVADIIDNSISANASSIWVDYEWKGPNTILSILDDGVGMNNDELVQAMRPGSKNPLDPRSAEDLGRFGLGLKTASLSQSRKFTVISKAHNGQPNMWCWDLDYVNKVETWSMIKYCPDANKWLSKVDDLSAGTCVLWWDMDRLTKDTVEDSQESKDNFLTVMEDVKIHLSMVFHKFIEDGLTIKVRNRKIESWDPFMLGYGGLQTKPESKFQNKKVSIKGFVLPHRSKLSPEDYNYGKGPKDSWTAHQGFYVYRKKRLLVAGDWLGLFKREVHYDLCRVQINLPNDVDEEWQIDIKKSIARPPAKYIDHITSIAKDVRNQALEVYRHKGKVLRRKLSKEQFLPLWEERIRHGKRFYKINRFHPLIIELYSNAKENKGDIEKVLQFIEETVPIPLITLKENENEQPHGQPFEGLDHSNIKETMQKLYEVFRESGMNDERAKGRILNTEPYNYYPEYIEFLKN